MSRKKKPNWQPISMLSTIANHIREGLSDTENQYQNLLEAKDKPYVLDDEIVSRVIRVHTTQLNDLSIFEQQVARWKRLTLRPNQVQDIETLSSHLKQLREVNEKILELAEQLKEGTINRILEKDDFELGLEVLLGKWKI